MPNIYVLLCSTGKFRRDRLYVDTARVVRKYAGYTRWLAGGGATKLWTQSWDAIHGRKDGRPLPRQTTGHTEGSTTARGSHGAFCCLQIWGAPILKFVLVSYIRNIFFWIILRFAHRNFNVTFFWILFVSSKWKVSAVIKSRCTSKLCRFRSNVRGVDLSYDISKTNAFGIYSSMWFAPIVTEYTGFSVLANFLYWFLSTVHFYG